MSDPRDLSGCVFFFFLEPGCVPYITNFPTPCNERTDGQTLVAIFFFQVCAKSALSVITLWQAPMAVRERSHTLESSFLRCVDSMESELFFFFLLALIF